MADQKKNWFIRHKVLTVIIVLFVLGLIGSAAGGSKSGTTTVSSDTTGTSASPKAQTAKVGETANDGKFQFTVSSITCGKTSVGANQYLTKQPQGQYCLLSVSVKNIGELLRLSMTKLQLN